MIVLTVISYNGAPAQGPSASFDELGGSIGRADTNQLVLPDPERTVSRVHAKVLFRNGAFAIVDTGSNPISLNGQRLNTGHEHPLRPGDELEIGGYRVRAAAGAPAAVTDDPFADLFGVAAGGLAAPPPAPVPTRSVMTSWPAASAPPPAPAALGPGHIPYDWDPFAIDAAPAPAPALTPPSVSVGGGVPPLGPAGGESLDALFGLSGLGPAADPLGVLPPAAPAPSTLEQGSELNTPMPLKAAVIPPSAIVSWDAEATSVSPPTMIRPRAPQAVPPPQPAASLPTPPQPVAPAPAPGPGFHVPPQADPFAPAPATASAALPAEQAALLAALLEGLGAPGLRIERLSPELMRLIGQLLRESTRGAVELLVARAALKREMRAEMTMIVARENNPLKFSPSAEVALQHLLGPPAPGFMAPAPAVRDAFDDLRAHQLGVMAGMKAALEEVLGRFDPRQLEAKLTRRSAIDSLIPATRKARLWEAFTELFGQLQTEAQDDFDELFGKAFLRAYEAQLDRLSQER